MHTACTDTTRFARCIRDRAVNIEVKLITIAWNGKPDAILTLCVFTCDYSATLLNHSIPFAPFVPPFVQARWRDERARIVLTCVTYVQRRNAESKHNTTLPMAKIKLWACCYCWLCCCWYFCWCFGIVCDMSHICPQSVYAIWLCTLSTHNVHSFKANKSLNYAIITRTALLYVWLNCWSDLNFFLRFFVVVVIVAWFDLHFIRFRFSCVRHCVWCLSIAMFPYDFTSFCVKCSVLRWNEQTKYINAKNEWKNRIGSKKVPSHFTAVHML